MAKLKKMRKRELRAEVWRLRLVESELRRQIKVWEERKISWKQQFDAEVYYKNQAVKEIEQWKQSLDEQAVELNKEIEHWKTKYKQQYQCNDEYVKCITDLQDRLSPPVAYTGEMPNNLNMGVDGQLVEQVNTGDCVGHKPPEEEESEAVAWEQSPVTNEVSEWAKRNGHHFPNGKPGKDRSTSVVVKHPEEISQENKDKHSNLTLLPPGFPM